MKPSDNLVTLHDRVQYDAPISLTLEELKEALIELIRELQQYDSEEETYQDKIKDLEEILSDKQEKIEELEEDVKDLKSDILKLKETPESAEDLQAKFIAYHSTHPEVYKIFERMALTKIDAGRKSYGSKALVQDIRWETQAAAMSEEGYKIPDFAAGYYARLFMCDHPGFRGFFRISQKIGVSTVYDDPAVNPPLFKKLWPGLFEEWFDHGEQWKIRAKNMYPKLEDTPF